MSEYFEKAKQLQGLIEDRNAERRELKQRIAELEKVAEAALTLIDSYDFEYHMAGEVGAVRNGLRAAGFLGEGDE